MGNKYDLKSIITGLLITIIGIVTVLFDIFVIKTEQNIWISVGCSLLASGIVILATALLVDVRKVDYLEEWGLEKIYKTRAEKNADSDPKLEKAKKQIDAVAFGLKTFRTTQTKSVEKALKNGVNFRILTMCPADDNVFFWRNERRKKMSRLDR